MPQKDPLSLIGFQKDAPAAPQDIDRLLAQNQVTAAYGLTLSRAQAISLLQSHHRALNRAGRLSFGGGILDPIIALFHASPYLTKDNYADTLAELVSLFYDFKNETMDLVSDDALLDWMKTAFDGGCAGSITLLAQALDALSRHIRNGKPLDTFPLSSIQGGTQF